MVLNLRIPEVTLGNLFIGVYACFIIFSPIETLGSPCSCLCGLSIMNLKLFDTYHIINSQVLAVTLGYLGDIRVLVDLCLKVLF